MQGATEKMNTDELLKATEVAAWLRVTERTIWRWVKQGKLTPKRFGGATRFPRSEVERLAA